jgi:hypothetical protein
MSDRDVIERVYDVLEAGFADSEFTVSTNGRSIFLAANGQEWCLPLFTIVEKESP